MTDGTVRTVLVVHVALVLASLGGLFTAGVAPDDLWSTAWWVPALVVNLGILAGNVVMLALGATDVDPARVAGEGRREDLEDSRRIVVDQLRVLDAERDKLAPEDYARERAELLAVGAAAARELEAFAEPQTSISANTVVGGFTSAGPPTSPATAPHSLGPVEALAIRLQLERESDPETFDEALARMGLVRSGGISGEWRGALYTLLAVGLLATMAWFAAGASRNRAPGDTMTGGDQTMAAPPSAAATPPADPCGTELRKRLAADPSDLGALNECTERAVAGQDLQTALEMNDKALQVAPDDLDARVLRGVLLALVDVNARDRAMQQIDDVIAADPKHLRALVYRGLLSMRSDPKRAVEVLEQALAVEDNAQVRMALAEARRQLAGGGPPAPSEPPATTGTPRVFAEGVLTVAPEAQASGSIVFVSFRPADQPGGPPLGATRLPPGPFPLAFRLTEADVIPMGRGRPVPDRLLVTATLDADGDAKTKDGPTATLADVTLGATGLEIVLR